MENRLNTIRRVLLVDDHEVVRRGLAAVLQSEGELELCGEAEDAESAIAAIQKLEPHLVLLDLSLKDGNGLDVLHRISKEYPNVLVLVLSMHDEAIYAERALRAGARGYVKKMDPAHILVAAIHKVLAGQIHVSEAVSSKMLERLSGGKRCTSPYIMDRLTDRELEVMRCIGQGMNNRQMAEQLNIATKTVESHREHIKQKLGLTSSSDLTRYAIEFVRAG